MKMTMTHDIY